MNIQEILNKARECGAEAVSAVEEMRQKNQEIAADAQAAYDAYFADVRQREARIRQRVEALGQERDVLSEKIRATQPALVAATIEGNTDAVGKIQSDIADMEAQRAAKSAQIELLSGARVPGSGELFQMADEKLERLREDGLQCRKVTKMVHDFAREQADFWEKVYNDTRYHDLAGGNVYHSEKIYEHFRQK